MDEVIRTLANPQFFVTAILARWHAPTGTLTFLNCGHPPGYLADPEGALRALEGPVHAPLGSVDGERTFEPASIQLESGQRLILVTDGVIDRDVEGGGTFGVDGLRRAVRRRAGADRGRHGDGDPARGHRVLGGAAAGRRHADRARGRLSGDSDDRPRRPRRRSPVTVAWNPARDPAWSPAPGLEPRARALHHALADYAPTPLLGAPVLAAELGLGSVLLKDESSRFGLPSFKALGAWWAAAWAVAERLGAPELATEPEALRERAAAGPPLTLVCATEGNHGRAVARIARALGLAARIVVPAGIAGTRVEAIEAEGARVERADGDYDAAIRARRRARPASAPGRRRHLMARLRRRAAPRGGGLRDDLRRARRATGGACGGPGDRADRRRLAGRRGGAPLPARARPTVRG